MKGEIALELKHVTKRFGNVIANKDVSLEVKHGEILAVLGENGSGKTTLMNMISGIYYPDEGDIYIDGVKAHISSPKDAFKYGIGMIHQHFKLVDVFSAAENIALGMRRFVIGLGKKVLIANLLGSLCTAYRESTDPSVLFSWMYAISFSLQIYFDFSAYSDMAIGIGKILGFRFLENFNYPFISKSITEFWRRWHISLGSWFRDYVYIPLGGNRVKPLRQIFNIMVVWCLTGFWHGAGWTFMSWGLYFGILLIIEKLFLKKYLEKSPAFIQHFYVIFLVLISFVLFNAETFTMAFSDLKIMFGAAGLPLYTAETLYHLRSYAVLLVIALVGATPLARNLSRKLENTKISTILEPVVIAVIIIVSTAYLVDGSFNPFLYFRF